MSLLNRLMRGDIQYDATHPFYDRWARLVRTYHTNSNPSMLCFQWQPEQSDGFQLFAIWLLMVLLNQHVTNLRHFTLKRIDEDKPYAPNNVKVFVSEYLDLTGKKNSSKETAVT